MTNKLELVPRHEVVVSEATRAIILSEPGRCGKNDTEIEAWNGQRWVKGWMSWLRAGMVFRFMNSKCVGRDHLYQSRTNVMIDRSLNRDNPTLVIGAVDVVQSEFRDMDEVESGTLLPAPVLRLTDEDSP